MWSPAPHRGFHAVLRVGVGARRGLGEGHRGGGRGGHLLSACRYVVPGAGCVCVCPLQLRLKECYEADVSAMRKLAGLGARLRSGAVAGACAHRFTRQPLHIRSPPVFHPQLLPCVCFPLCPVCVWGGGLSFAASTVTSPNGVPEAPAPAPDTSPKQRLVFVMGMRLGLARLHQALVQAQQATQLPPGDTDTPR